MSAFSFIDPAQLALAAAIAMLAGAVKGLVGFAMPMILISGLGSFLAPELALAGLILPTLVTNGVQALRQGWRAAWESLRRFRLFLAVGGAMLVMSAQLVRVLPGGALLLLIGVPITGFAVWQLFGAPLRLAAANPRIEAALAAVAGFFGGLSGVWGPPVVAYLTALDTPKAEQVRIQGVIYGMGAVALTLSHMGSGVLNAATAPFSAVLVLPALLGMSLGFRWHDGIDQAAFRKATLVVLLVAGLNLVRRGLTG